MHKMLEFALAAIMIAAPVQAEVSGRSENGFAVGGSEVVVASPGQTWRTLVTPALWWNKDHT